MAPTSSAVLWSQCPEEGLVWPSSQDMGRGGKLRREEFISFFLHVCVYVCVVSGGGGDVCVVSLHQKLLGAIGVFAGLSLCLASAMHLLCVLCARRWRAAILWELCVC